MDANTILNSIDAAAYAKVLLADQRCPQTGVRQAFGASAPVADPTLLG
jgi:hypothetical protein